ncbi:MAG: prenyltransferase [candidate division Zixibacteria bacterium]|nr:prenyltransferase [candidate division Zixibacteria bacterium]
MSLKTFFLETRPQFLILSLVLIILSTSMAFYDGIFNIKYTLLTLIGLLLLHTSVNTLNDYYDYKSGIDLKANRTPFSGGSGLLTSGKISAGQTFWLGIISFILAVPIGIYFILNKGWFLLPIFILGAIFVLFYTSFLAKLGLGFSEISAGLGLGTLPVLGVYLILNKGFSFQVLFASIPSGILVCNLLFLNEFPDAEADKVGGRKTLPIILGKDKAAKLYSALTLLVYVWIVLGVIFKIMPPFTLIALLTLPLALKAISGSIAHSDITKILPAQGANVMVVLVTQFLLGIGYILARVI